MTDIDPATVHEVSDSGKMTDIDHLMFEDMFDLDTTTDKNKTH